MFNPNGTFKWSVDLATVIYSNPKANTTWEYFYPQICKYMKDRGITCSIIEENGDVRLVKANTLLLKVVKVMDTIGISFMVVTPLENEILDEAYDNKILFGLPVSTMSWDDSMRIATITFMSRNSWEELNSPEAREMERMFNRIDRMFGL